MSKEYESELEKTIEHLHKVIEEKTTIIDQQRELLDKFMKGDIMVGHQDAGYVSVGAAYASSAGPGPLSSFANFTGPGPLGHVTSSNSSSSSSDDDDDKLPQGDIL